MTKICAMRLFCGVWFLCLRTILLWMEWKHVQCEVQNSFVTKWAIIMAVGKAKQSTEFISAADNNRNAGIKTRTAQNCIDQPMKPISSFTICEWNVVVGSCMRSVNERGEAKRERIARDSIELKITIWKRRRKVLVIARADRRTRISINKTIISFNALQFSVAQLIYLMMRKCLVRLNHYGCRSWLVMSMMNHRSRSANAFS